MFIDPRKNLSEERVGGSPPLPPLRYPPGPQTPPPIGEPPNPDYPTGPENPDNPFPWEDYPPIYGPDDWGDSPGIPDPPYPNEPSPTGSKDRPRPVNPNNAPPFEPRTPDVPNGWNPFYDPGELHLETPQMRWYAYYLSWYRYWTVQQNLLETNLELVTQEYQARVCDGSTTSICKRLEEQMKQINAALAATYQKLGRLEKVMARWRQIIWEKFDPYKREIERRRLKKKPAPSSWKKWLRRLAGVMQQRDPQNPLFAQFGEQDTYSGRDIIAVLQQQYQDAAMTGQFANSIDLEQALADLAELFEPGRQYTLDEIYAFLYPAGMERSMRGQTSMGTYSQGGQFGATPTPTIPTEPPPPEEPARPEGELARAFAKFNRGRLGRGMR